MSEGASRPGHLILIGLPGAGKSTHGRRVARLLDRPFVDLDVRIAQAAGASVTKLFRDEGESAFRARERAETERLSAEVPSIVAPGGGWMMDPANVELVKPGATVVWLQVSPLVAVRRMGRRIRLRPLLRGSDPVGALEELYARRADRYAAADVVVDTERYDWQQLARVIAALAPPLR